MKNKLFILSLFVGSILITSCSHGPSAETKMKVASFDSSWSAMAAIGKGWGDSLNMAASNCEMGCKNGDAMACCEHLKTTKDSLMMPCKNDMAMFQEMKKSWDAQVPMWDSLTNKVNELKEKVAGGKVGDQEINAELAGLQTILDNGNSRMAGWVTKFNDAKMNCMKNMEACKSSWGNAKCTAKKCSMTKKA